MSPENKAVTLKRILVPLDASVHSRAALEAAAQLARAIGAELSGLYVEDADLLEMCRYPFAREIGMLPVQSRRLDSRDLEKDFRIQAEQIRRMMALLARDTDINWSLTVRRGRVVSEILEQAPNADLVVLGRLGRSLTGTQLGSTVRCLIEQGRGMALILREGLKLLSPVITVYTGSDLSKRAVHTASRVAFAVEGHMEILIPAETEDKFAELRDEILLMLETDPLLEGKKIRFRRIRTHVAAALVTVLRAEYRQPIVLPVDAINGDAEAIQQLINRIDNPVLLVQ